MADFNVCQSIMTWKSWWAWFIQLWLWVSCLTNYLRIRTDLSIIYAPSDILPPAILLAPKATQPSKQQQFGAKCSNTWLYREHFIFRSWQITISSSQKVSLDVMVRTWRAKWWTNRKERLFKVFGLLNCGLEQLQYSGMAGKGNEVCRKLCLVGGQGSPLWNDRWEHDLEWQKKSKLVIYSKKEAFSLKSVWHPYCPG